MSKRIPIIVIGLVVLFLLVTPFAIGVINANALEERVAEIDKNMPFDFALEDFERGWFSSSGRLVFSLGPDFLAQYPELATDPAMGMVLAQTLPINLEVGHGPLLLSDGFGFGTASVKATLSPDNQLSLLAEQFLGMPYVFEMRGRAGFGSFTYEGEIPPGELAMGNESFTMSGVEFSGMWTPKAQDLEATLASMELQSPFASAIVDSIELNNHATMTSPDSMPLSDGTLSVKRITVSNPLLGGTPMFDLNDVVMTNNVVEAEESGYLDSSVMLQMGNLIVQGMEVSNAALGFHVDHISSEAADMFVAFGREMQGVSDPDVILAMLTPLAEPLLAGGPVFSIDPMRLGMREGDIDGHLRIAVAPDTLNMAMLQDPMGAVAALGALTGELELTAAKPLVQMIASMIVSQQMVGIAGPEGQPISPQEAQMMAQGQVGQLLGMLAAQNLIIDEGDTYTTRIDLANGMPTANGQPLNLLGF